MRTKIKKSWLAMGLAFIAIVVVYGWFDPSVHAWFPRCPFLMLTGWRCIGCGSQRALHAMLHGHWGDVWRYNAAIVLLSPYLIALLLTAAIYPRWARLHAMLRHYGVIRGLIVVLVLWWIARNVWGWYV